MIEGIGKITKQSSARTRFLSIPAQVAADDRFPFETGEQVRITIEPENKRLIVEKVE
jgi:hypothetical protein